MTDLATLVTVVVKLESKKAREVTAAIIQKLSQFSFSWVKTLTFDNGKEFAFHEKVASKTSKPTSQGHTL